MKTTVLDNDPLWYRDAIIYELHIRAFSDSNGDGNGDIRGLIGKLDYLDGLGITALWLLPFYPSPLRDDGYDIADYYSIHPDYGDMKDFRLLVREAHRRGIRVITELVLNHTSSEHAWFRHSRAAKPGSPWRDMYVWSDTPEKYQDARIIFKDFEPSNWCWDPEAKAYYWHRFYSHQPDLNYDSPQVHRKMLEVIDFWFGLGVDGVRLDAVPYLYEREGTNCENLPETHAFLKKLRAHVDAKFPNKMFLAEANQWPEDAAAYFGQADECNMAFHFPLMPRMFMAIQMEDSFPIIDILRSTPPIPDGCQWAVFLRNHDELTLEMVTDEERDYMYRSYAQDPRAKINLGIRRRLAPLLGNNRRRIELMNILLFSFPGTPVLYYGDEIGMGDNYYLGDRNGVRTPMQWTPDRNAGFSRANPHSLYLPVIIDPDYHHESVNVENQERNLSSLLWWMKRVIAVRKRFKAFSRGSIEFLQSSNPKVLCFIRRYEQEVLLVAVNLSRFSQAVELDLSMFAGDVPEEVFSGNIFPVIRETPYALTFSSHSHYWLQIRRGRSSATTYLQSSESALSVRGGWESVFEKKAAEALRAEVLPSYMKTCRWFAGKAQVIRSITIAGAAALHHETGTSRLLLLEVRYNEGVPEVYLLPVSFAAGSRAKQICSTTPRAVIARLHTAEGKGVLYDAIHDEGFRNGLLKAVTEKKRLDSAGSSFQFLPHRRLKRLLAGASAEELASTVLSAEQSNSSILYGNRLFLKLYRRLDSGTNPELEMIRHLTDKARFAHVPALGGAIEYRQKKSGPMTIALLQHCVPEAVNAWILTTDAVSRYYERVLARSRLLQETPLETPDLFDTGIEAVPDVIRDLIGLPYLEAAAQLGRRTAEMHLALASALNDPDFAPEPFSMLYQRSVFQSMQSLLQRTMALVARSSKTLPDTARADALAVIAAEPQLLAVLRALLDKKLSATKIRIHGDYHLGQVLYTGKDYMIIDFEGEPARTLSERRLKYCPCKDIAGMLRSFHYAACGALLVGKTFRPEDKGILEPWSGPWAQWTGAVFLNAYMEASKNGGILPVERGEVEILLRSYLIEKAVYELGYELASRPDWISVPLRGILEIVSTGA